MPHLELYWLVLMLAPYISIGMLLRLYLLVHLVCGIKAARWCFRAWAMDMDMEGNSYPGLILPMLGGPIAVLIIHCYEWRKKAKAIQKEREQIEAERIEDEAAKIKTFEGLSRPPDYRSIETGPQPKGLFNGE